MDDVQVGRNAVDQEDLIDTQSSCCEIQSQKCAESQCPPQIEQAPVESNLAAQQIEQTLLPAHTDGEPPVESNLAAQQIKQTLLPSCTGGEPTSGSQTRDQMQMLARPLASELDQNGVAQPAAASDNVSSSKQEGNVQPVMKMMPVVFGSSAVEGNPFQIVCYGDSLTAGYCSRGRVFEPYGRTLSDTLGQLGVISNVAVCGLVGKTAKEMVDGIRCPVLSDSTGNMGQGLNRMLVECKPNLAIIMAGTNDLSRNSGPESIFDAIKKLHEACHSYQIPTVALMPPHKLRGAVRKTQERVASFMIEWSRATSAVVALFDVEKLAPRKPAGQNWDADEIHLSRAGQRGFGERLAERLACLPLFKERLALANAGKGMIVCDDAGSGAQQVTGRKRTLTGFLASTKAAAPPTNDKSDLGQLEDSKADRSQSSIQPKWAKLNTSTSKKSASKENQVASCDLDSSNDRKDSPAVARARLCVSLPASTFAVQVGPSGVLHKIAQDLAREFSKSNLMSGHGMYSIGLSIACDGSGWSGHCDVDKCRGEGLSGDTIQRALKTLADRSCKALGVSIDSVGAGIADKGDKSSKIQCVTAYLHASDTG